jgi:hypothetical protein
MRQFNTKTTGQQVAQLHDRYMTMMMTTTVTHYIHNANSKNKEPIPPVKAWCNETNFQKEVSRQHNTTGCSKVKEKEIEKKRLPKIGRAHV